MKTLDIHEIRRLLPHRFPFLLVDRVESYELGKTLRAIKNVTANEPFFNGHFPDRPVMPGVLILEALAQAGGLLAGLSSHALEPGELFLFAAVDKARFKRIVEPGDQLILDVSILKFRRDLVKVYAEASVVGELACSAELMSIRKGGEPRDTSNSDH
jgi:3-hydroxyacyl-[acyl-carrier-protein] dehydratase